MVSLQPTGALTLPPLRQDVQLLPGATDEDGSPGWLIYDPLRNSYFRIGLDAFNLLKIWEGGMELSTFLKQASAQGGDVDEETLSDMLHFLQLNQLLQVHDESGRNLLQQINQGNQQHWFKWLIHHYLFIKIPLWRPDHFLSRTLPWVEPLFDRRLLMIVRLLGIIGIFLVVRQWDLFTATFLHFFSWQGLALYGITLAVIKSAHELGHAYTARRRGCRVSSIGVAFLVLFPVLYTDTTDAYRLRSRHDRLSIVLAGMKTELHIALLATFLWSFLPDGPMRSVAFFVATTSWLTSLTVNITPFMRFDGYFALADWLGADNLQPRAFALGRWKLREWLFGLGEAPPEVLTPEREKIFILYAWMTWVYRLFLFLGIALLVYYFTFKVLGIVLFLVEIVWFIGLPISREMKEWWMRKGQLRFNRNSWISLSGLAVISGIFIVPWSPSIEIPAVMVDRGISRIFTPEPARLSTQHVQRGDQVETGTLLVELDSPDLLHEIALAEQKIKQLETEHRRRAGSKEQLRSDLITQHQLEELREELQGLVLRKQRLRVVAPVNGRVSHIKSMSEGQWLNQHRPLLIIQSNEGAQFHGFVAEESVHRFDVGAPGVWVTDSGTSRSIEVEVSQIERTALPTLPYSELASDFGGPIAVRRSRQDELRTEQGVYRITLSPLSPLPSPTQRQSGIIQIEGERQSIVRQLMTHVAAVLMRESGF